MALFQSNFIENVLDEMDKSELARLARKFLTVDHLPMGDIQRWLEKRWNADANELLGDGSITKELVADSAAAHYGIGLRTTAFDIANAVPGSTAMPFDNNVTSGMAVNNSNGTITTARAGINLAVGFFSWGAGVTGTTLDLYILTNGTVRRGENRTQALAGGAGILTVSGMWLSGGSESVQLMIGQNSGSTSSSGAGSANIPWYLGVLTIPFT